ncbi:PLP-dependent aminotransferase family protein [Nesterenkonia populi]|uniref:MocR-like pyridoxine biosynthesis transcription factor PdxR n=1 Tax=Nesterenkonia populi TaxID=1591087 RepID=UPI0011BF37B4|nr:PLP-dependent aminotransferase family protein [Nesterenkonia populi]
MTVDLVLSVDRAAKLSLQSQLAEQLRRAVLEGRLEAGDPIPASRPLAKHLGISRGTVVAALEQLHGEGYIESHPGRGSVVAPIRHLQFSAHPAGGLPEGSHLKRRSDSGEVSVDLRPGYPWTRDLSGDSAWRAAWRTASRNVPAATVHEDDPAGAHALRRALAEHLRRARGVTAGPEDLHITAGTSDALLLLVLALKHEHGQVSVAVEDPGYPSARRTLTAAGADLHPLSVTEQTSIDIELLPQAVQAVMVTPSHQYPLGGIMSVGDRLKLLKWAQDHGALVIEDDYDSEFRYDRASLPALSSLSEENNVVTVGSFSKILSPALRMGYIYAPGAMGDKLLRTRQAVGPSVSYIQQHALAQYIDGGGLSRHISRTRREYRHRRDLLLNHLTGIPGVEVSATSGGLHAIIHTPSPADQLAASLRKDGIAVGLLSDYGFGELCEEENALVIGYGNVTSLQLTQALARMDRILR